MFVFEKVVRQHYYSNHVDDVHIHMVNQSNRYFLAEFHWEVFPMHRMLESFEILVFLISKKMNSRYLLFKAQICLAWRPSINNRISRLQFDWLNSNCKSKFIHGNFPFHSLTFSCWINRPFSSAVKNDTAEHSTPIPIRNIIVHNRPNFIIVFIYKHSIKITSLFISYLEVVWLIVCLMNRNVGTRL